MLRNSPFMPQSSPTRVCVYCGSSSGIDSAYEHAAKALGTGLARHGIVLVYGGGRNGLMGALADATLSAGGEVIGVIPRALCERELAHPKLSELIVVDDMPQRKAQLAARAEAFIALPGGFGTLEELSEALSWAQLSLHTKPIFLLNIDGYFDALIAFFDQMFNTGFLDLEHRSLVRIVERVDDFWQPLNQYSES